jgi:hypothetical protein
MSYDTPNNNIMLTVVRIPVAWRGVVGGRVGRWCGGGELRAEPSELLFGEGRWITHGRFRREERDTRY